MTEDAIVDEFDQARLSMVAPSDIPARAERIRGWIKRSKYAPTTGGEPSRSHVYRIALILGMERLEREAAAGA